MKSSPLPSRILRKALSVMLAATLAVGAPAASHAQSSDVLSSIVSGSQGGGGGCSSALSGNMTNNLRRGLDNAANRFAAALFPPGSTDGMGCLSNITSLFGNVKSIFSGQSGFDLNSVVEKMAGGVQNALSSAICGFARAAVTMALKSLSSGLSGGGSSTNYGAVGNQSWSSIASSITNAANSATSGSGSSTQSTAQTATTLYNQLLSQGLQPSVNTLGQTTVTTSNGTVLTFNNDGTVSATASATASSPVGAAPSPGGSGVLIGSGVTSGPATNNYGN